jgi:hypothetical protein
VRALARERRCWLLVLAVNHVAFYEGDARGLSPASVPGLPASMVDALGENLTPGQLQAHSGAAHGGEIMFHGQGGAGDERAIDLERFHRVVGRALVDHLKDAAVPLVLAADQRHQGPFRAHVKIAQLLKRGVVGSPERLSAKDLHERAWPIVDGLVERDQETAAAAFEQARNLGKATDRLDTTVQAAVVGRIRRLWLHADARVPGTVDAESGRMIAGKNGHDDVLEQVTAIVLRRGGEVIVVDEAPHRLQWRASAS